MKKATTAADSSKAAIQAAKAATAGSTEPGAETPKPGAATARPIVTMPPGGTFTVADPQPVDLKAEGYTDGVYVYLAEGEEMRLRKVKDDPRGNTHHLKSQRLTWEGTEIEFRQAFEKK